ncbi:MAG: 4-phosphoerythronate dehydrogenase PdxB [Candidatus Hydrogenedentes bacterium]|nr:4-phosphoerythronate dehydrogenase PdxB [Candidatus Hydrogenedentota bacterium]
MRIVADENIPFVREAFAALGEVTTLPGREIDAAAVRYADMLLVRSITKVNRELLDGSRVQFVATATIGEDHVDTGYLAEQGIAFSSAPGCNANSVAQYVTAALLELAARLDLDLPSLRLGIIGVGNVGKRVLAKATALGMECVLNDPPLWKETGDDRYRPIEEMHSCDIVTLHVPLTLQGRYATHHLAGERLVWNMRPKSILINTSRGPVADGNALKGALHSGHLRACVLDVWEDEPRVDEELLRGVFIGTPHIAGYSFDGKVNGTRQIYGAACRHLGVEPDWDSAPLLPTPECPEVRVPGGGGMGAVRDAVRAVYDIWRDDAAMRTVLDAPEEERPAVFDRLRKEYPRRREFFNTRAVVEPADTQLETQLGGLGFAGRRDS